jgi:hypothetical protein
MFPVRHEHHLQVKNEILPVTDHGGLKDCEMLRGSHILNRKGNIRKHSGVCGICGEFRSIRLLVCPHCRHET